MRQSHTLLDAWADTVTAVADGYSLTYDDYLNDLDVRRAIDVSALRESGRDRLRSLDERFTECTVPSEECVWGADNAAAEQWDPVTHWYYWRLPKSPGPNFSAS